MSGNHSSDGESDGDVIGPLPGDHREEDAPPAKKIKGEKLAIKSLKRY